MAENKKSYMGYVDWGDTFDMLDDGQAGKLIKHFYAYLRDENPVLDDQLLKMAFHPIKLQLKRDLVKYEDKIKKWSEAGKKSAEAKAALKKATDEEYAALNPTKSTDVDSVVTKSTVNENEDVIDIDNVTDTVNENVTETNKKFLVPEMFAVFKKEITTYPGSVNHDYKPLLSIANFLCDQASVEGGPENNVDSVLQAWKSVCLVIKDDNFYSQKSLSTIANHIQEILQQALHGKKSSHSKIAAKPTTDDLQAAHARRYPVG